MKRSLIVGGGISIPLVAGLYWQANPHVWKAVSIPRLTVDGQLETGTGVYRSVRGEILILMSKDEGGAYIYYPSQGRLGFPNRDNFIRLPLFVFSKEVSPSVVISDDRIKISPTSIWSSAKMALNSHHYLVRALQYNYRLREVSSSDSFWAF
jgi:hypothetical protein